VLLPIQSLPRAMSYDRKLKQIIEYSLTYAPAGVHVSDITIHKVVIHALIKEQHEPIQPSRIRVTVLDAQNDTVGKMVAGVVSVYGGRNNSAHYGIFKTGEGRGNFPDMVERYAGTPHPTDIQFLDLTRTAMNRLYDKASANQASSGGYLVFSDYSNAQGRFFLVGMVKQKPGITLTDQLEPEELMQLDLGKLHQAARVNFGKLSSYLAAGEIERQELNYLSFVSPGSTRTAAGYFVTALGCSEGAASAQATRTLITEGRRLFRETVGLQSQEEAFNSNLLSYCHDKAEARDSVKLREIENIVRRYIPDAMAEEAETVVDRFIARLNSEECAVPVEFMISPRALKKMTHIKVKSSRWEVSFDRAAFGSEPSADIYYDAAAGKLTIQNIPQSMRSMLENELASQNPGSRGGG